MTQLGPATQVSAWEPSSQVPWKIWLLMCLDLLTCDAIRDLCVVTHVLIRHLDIKDPADSVLGLLSLTSADPFN
jgi:hypothetical protein